MSDRQKLELVEDENPEWTVEDFSHARPAPEVLQALFSPGVAASMLQPKRGRPTLKNPKEHINIRIDADILAAFRATGSGWQTRLNIVLREWFESHSAA